MPRENEVADQGKEDNVVEDGVEVMARKRWANLPATPQRTLLVPAGGHQRTRPPWPAAHGSSPLVARVCALLWAHSPLNLVSSALTQWQSLASLLDHAPVDTGKQVSLRPRGAYVCGRPGPPNVRNQGHALNLMGQVRVMLPTNDSVPRTLRSRHAMSGGVVRLWVFTP